MENDRDRGSRCYTRESWSRQYGEHEQVPYDDRGYGSNFGEGARPYGEDYGEDLGYSSGRYHHRDDALRDHGRRGEQRSRYTGFDYHSGDRQFRHSSNRTSSDYQRDAGFAQSGRRGEYRDKDQRLFDEQRGRSRHYPETYRSAMSGYRSEHVGDDLGRQDYNRDPAHGNVYGQTYGGNKGKGPRSYRRSDERIREEVNELLTDDDYIDARDIDVQVQNCEVVLTGSVNNRIDKRRAEDIAGTVQGVTQVENRLRVGTGVSV